MISSYQYDGLNRLIRENIPGWYIAVYKYDKGGNLLFKKQFDYSVASGSTVTELLNSSAGSTVNYGYSGDLLTSYKGSGTLEYDNYGNPKKWFKHGTDSSQLKYTLQWGHVSNLTAIIDEDSGKQYSYKYNDQGIRTEKVVNGVTHRYYLQGENIIAEKYGSNLIKFYYDSTGICGFNYSGKDYYYRKNMQGDIIAIYNGSGNCYATYGYDAWGRFTIFTNLADIATINPFRYRGYYYDNETGLYYLNSRYYDPEIGRFISPDSTDYLDPETIDGLNLYAYCLNNPVMYTDPEGTSWWSDFWNSVAGKIVGTVLVVAAVVALSVLTAGVGGAVTVALGGGFWAAVAGGAVGGAISGAVFGGGFSMIIQGISNGYGNIDWGKVGIDTLMGGLAGAATGAIFAAAGRGLGLLGKTKWAQRTLKNFNDVSKNYMFGSKSGNFTFFRNGKTFRIEASIQHGLHYHALAAKTTAPQWKSIFNAFNYIAGLIGGGIGNAIY